MHMIKQFGIFIVPNGMFAPSHPRYGAWSGLRGTHWPPPRVMTPLVETAPASPGSLVASTRTALE